MLLLSTCCYMQSCSHARKSCADATPSWHVALKANDVVFHYYAMVSTCVRSAFGSMLLFVFHLLVLLDDMPLDE